MNGLEAINHYNGWAMAFLGAIIVFSGLVVLSLAISQFKRVFLFLEQNEQETEQDSQPQAQGSPAAAAVPLPVEWPTDSHEIAKLYQPLFDKLESNFKLEDLYRLTAEHDYPHPHLTIKQLREAQIIVPTGDGNFSVSLSCNDV